MPPSPVATTTETTEVPPSPVAAKEETQQDDNEEEDGGEHDVLIAPLPEDVVDTDTFITFVKGVLMGGEADDDSETIINTAVLGNKSAGVVTFASEKDAMDALTLLRKYVQCELKRKTLWPNELVLFDPKRTSIRVSNVPSTINEDVVRQIFGTYGGVHKVEMGPDKWHAIVADGQDSSDVVVVTMADRDGAETASAALSGVYRFEEGQENPVAVSWCSVEPEVNVSTGVGEKRKRDDEEPETTKRVSERQIALVGVPENVSESDIAGFFECESNENAFVTLFPDSRTAFVTFGDEKTATNAIITHGVAGTLRPPGSPVPLTLRRLIVNVELRPEIKKREKAPPVGVYPPVLKPGPQYGEPSSKVYIGSIPAQYGDSEVRSIFSTVGKIKEVKILRRNDGSHKGSGFVQFHDIQAAERAIHFIDGKYVLNAPGFPQQKPLYMKFAAVGGGGGRQDGRRQPQGSGYGNYGGQAMGAMGGYGGHGWYGQAYGGYPQQQAYGGYGAQAYGAQAQQAAAYQQYYAQQGAAQAYAQPGDPSAYQQPQYEQQYQQPQGRYPQQWPPQQ